MVVWPVHLAGPSSEGQQEIIFMKSTGVQHWANVSQKSSNLGEFVSFADLTSVSELV